MPKTLVNDLDDALGALDSLYAAANRSTHDDGELEEMTHSYKRVKFHLDVARMKADKVEVDRIREMRGIHGSAI